MKGTLVGTQGTRGVGKQKQATDKERWNITGLNHKLN